MECILYDIEIYDLLDLECLQSYQNSLYAVCVNAFVLFLVNIVALTLRSNMTCATTIQCQSFRP